MMRYAQKIIGTLLLISLIASVVVVAYDFCYASPLLYPKCSVCELKKALDGTLKKTIEATLLVTFTDPSWSGLVLVAGEWLQSGDDSPSARRLCASPRTDRAPPELS